jgi:hypothetical protein
MPRKVSELNSIYPTDDLTLLKIRELYAHWNWVLSHSYITYHLGDARLSEHRLMGQVLYGCIGSKYHVHHINGCRTQNDSENLEVLHSSTHAKLHGFGGKPSCKIVVWCQHCGAKIERVPSEAKRNKRSFCNYECYSSYQRGGRPALEKESLASLLKSHSRTETARILGVSVPTMSKWAIRFGLIDPHKRA